MLELSYARHRPLVLLAAVVLAQVLLLAFQIKREHDVRLIRYWAEEAVTPFERGGSWTLSRISGVWRGYIGLRGTHAENARLRSEVDRLQMRNRELESQAAEAQRLSLLLAFREAHPEAPVLAAQVIGASADPSSHTIVVNRGERDHVRRNMAVITPDGIVGKVLEVFPTTSQVLLINDKESGVGALLADTRTHGVAMGTGDPNPLMNYVSNDEKVRWGEEILTSGEDRIFPKGLLIGTVTSTTSGSMFQAIRMQAAARLDRLEDVLILLSQQELAPKKTSEEATAAPAQSDSGVVPTNVTPRSTAPTGPSAGASPANSQARAPASPQPQQP